MTFSARALFYEEPDVECIVIKVNSTVKLQTLGIFPKQYQSINNDALYSRLRIGKFELPEVNPVQIEESGNISRIAITMDGAKIELLLQGPPMSRNGPLSVNGKILGSVTCH